MICASDIKILPSSATFIDIGCAFGTDVRKLYVDGVPFRQIFAVDENPDFYHLGMDLYEDSESRTKELNLHFSVANILVPEFSSKVSNLLLVGINKLKNNVLLISSLDSSSQDTLLDVVYLGSVLHLMNEEQCKLTIANCRKILKSKGILFGRTVGNDAPIQETRGSLHADLRFLHSPESLKALLIENGFQEDSIVIEWKPVEWNKFDKASPENKRLLSFFARVV